MEMAHMDKRNIGSELESSSPSSQRKPLSFNFRLPTEIFESIFIHYARDYFSKGLGPLPFAPSSVNVSYVCRHWRNIALNCPTFWTYLLEAPPRWTDELLARSGQASLKLHINLVPWDKGSRALRFMGKVMNHVERIQELSLRVPAKRIHEVLSKFFPSRAPGLQNLKVWISDADDPPTSDLSSLVPCDGDTPALRTLELTRCRVPRWLFKLSSLTTLSLHHVPPQFQQDIEELLATLRCMQELTDLYLEDALTSAAGFLSSTAFHNFQKVNLPRLSRLWIVTPLSTVLPLMVMLRSLRFLHKDSIYLTMIKHHSTRQFVHWPFKLARVQTGQVFDSVDQNVIAILSVTYFPMNGIATFLSRLIFSYQLG
ncbi:hypothetical protein OG21DRAFT_1487808 [Imleria badia]|nr:hypothetical protein OG21DRAFT_1487808 [Imleria badia]